MSDTPSSGPDLRAAQADGDGQATPAPEAPEPALASESTLAPESASESHLATIRDLLFGREMNAVERRFARLEVRMAEEHSALEDALLARLDALDAYVRDELASLNDGLGAERKARAEAVDAARQEARAAGEATDRRLDELQASTDTAGESIRRRIHEETQRAQTALRESAGALTRRLEDTAAQLDARKADRRALAALFADAAARLSDEASLDDASLDDA